MGDDKTEEPTEKKLQDSRKQGQVWKSRDLSGVAAFAVAMAVVKATWSDFEASIKTLFLFSIDKLSHPVDLETATFQLMLMGVVTILSLCLPIAFAAAIAGGLVEFLQVGALFAVEVLIPKLDKLNPVNGLKNMFSGKQLVEMLKSILKLSLTGYVVFGAVRDAMAMVVATIHGDAGLTMAVMGELVFRIVSRMVLMFVAFAIFDVWFQRRAHMKNLMMSKDDVKKEYKESEGDPHHKAHRKQMHMEIMNSEQMEAVKGADVIVTNPDHVAVALKYDKDKDAAPRLLAKGLDARAETIRQIAKQYEVPLLRNVPLAHALLRLDVNQEVPEDLYDAVAEVLNFVYQLKAPPVAARA